MHKTKAVAAALTALLAYASPAAAMRTSTDPSSTTSSAPLLASEALEPPSTSGSGFTDPNQIFPNTRITAYSSSEDETDSTPFITANGDYVHDGVIATNLLPLGSKVMIPSLFGKKVFTVEDRMNPRFSKSFDIWMPSKSKAIYFGLHYANILVLGTSTISTTGITLK